MGQFKDAGYTFKYGEDNVFFNDIIFAAHIDIETEEFLPVLPETIDFVSDFVKVYFPQDFPNGISAGWEPVYRGTAFDETFISENAFWAIEEVFGSAENTRIVNGPENEVFNDIVATTFINGGDVEITEGVEYDIIENHEGIFVKPNENIFDAISYMFSTNQGAIEQHLDFPIALGSYGDFEGFKVYNPGGNYSDYFDAKRDLITLFRNFNAGDEAEIAANLETIARFDVTTEEHNGTTYVKPVDSNIFDIVNLYVTTLAPDVYPDGLNERGFAAAP